MSKADSLYQTVTDRIIEDLQAGALPWTAEWSFAGGLPVNALTGRGYNGINILILWLMSDKRGYSSNRWATFQQIKQAGGTVKKGEKSTTVLFYKKLEIEDKDTKENKSIPMARFFNVFNLGQCDGLEIVDSKETEELESDISIDSFINQIGADIQPGKPSFIPSIDKVCIPNKNTFESIDAYYSTLFHELVHWTGHKSRLDRIRSTCSNNDDYAFEELVAEMGAAFLCARFNLSPTLRHSGYISHWLEHLGSDNRFVFKAAAQAQKAVDFLTPDIEEK